MKYKEKAQVLRSRPFTYEETEKYLRGAWRHWPSNPRLCEKIVANDRAFLEARRRVKAQGFVLE